MPTVVLLMRYAFFFVCEKKDQIYLVKLDTICGRLSRLILTDKVVPFVLDRQIFEFHDY